MAGFSIGANSLEEDVGPNAITEIHRVHRWSILQLGPIKLNTKTLYAKNLKLPSISFEEEVVRGASIDYKFAKVATWSDIELEFYDVLGLYEILLKWQGQIWNQKKGIQPATNYMYTCEFEIGQQSDGLVGSFDNGNVVIDTDTYKIKCFNCWPKSIDHGRLSYTSSELKTIVMTLSCSHSEMSPGGVS